MCTRGAADHAVWAWPNEGRGFCEGSGLLRAWFCGCGFCGQSTISISVLLSQKSFFFLREGHSEAQDKMGGGDLVRFACFFAFFKTFFASQNMKKSWHPLTLQNLERVWKAEQKNEAEQKRIAELQQEIKEERSREEMKQFAVDAGLAK